MLSVKVVYDSSKYDTMTPLQLFLQYSDNPLFEILDENNPKEKKKAWKYKSAAGTKEIPFISVYNEDGKLIKAFYNEDESATDSNFMSWFDDYAELNGKHGHIKVKRIKGESEIEREGEIIYSFFEGRSLHLKKVNGGIFVTSPITKIDWENNRFYTMNSVYSFEYVES